MDAPFELTHSRLVPWIVAGLAFLVFVAVLIGLFEPLDKPRNMAFRAEALHDEVVIVAAVKAFRTRYGKLPVDPNAPGVVVFSNDNNLLFDVLRNRTGLNTGNALNPRGYEALEVPPAQDQKHPKGGMQTSTGIWFDPWGTPYHIAINTGSEHAINGRAGIPGFYSDVGMLKNVDVIVWSYGENGKLGGGPALKWGFSSEPGVAGRLSGSGDVVSW